MADVALPTEGVDRNIIMEAMPPIFSASPSPRRAWIEIGSDSARQFLLLVALPTEGVDRNTTDDWRRGQKMSPSPRRAWIEIPTDLRVLLDGAGSPSPRRAWIEM